MKAEQLTDGIDITVDADSSCNDKNVTACCFGAIQAAAGSLAEREGEVTSVELAVTCPGYDPDRGGCQATVSGAFLNAAGLTIAMISTTAQELERNNPQS